LKICEDGTYASEDGKECVKCPAGNYCTEGEKHSCKIGQNCTNEGMAKEHVCSKGYHCSDPAKPTQCDKGTYNDLENQEQERSTRSSYLSKTAGYLMALVRDLKVCSM